MAITLTLNEGDDLFIGDRRVLLNRSLPDEAVVITEDSAFTLTRDKWVEVFSRCFMKIPEHWRASPHRRSTMRLQINAPAQVVVRGNLYRKGKETHNE